MGKTVLPSRLQRTVGIVLALLLSSDVHTGAAGPSGASIVALEIPFELVSGFLVVVQGAIGEHGGLRFVVDTGSTYSVIDREVADRLGLPRRPGKLMNFDRAISAERTDLPELRLGPIHASGLSIMVVRLADYSEFGQHLDGVIGLDLLRRATKLRIDYEKRTVSFQLRDHEADDAAGDSMSLGFILPVSIQGVSLHLLFDTGLRDILLYDERVRTQVPNLRTEGRALPARMGRLHATQVNLPGVEIFGPRAVTPVLLINGPENATLRGVDGYLGPASLHAKRLELDFAANTLRWQ